MADFSDLADQIDQAYFVKLNRGEDLSVEEIQMIVKALRRSSVAESREQLLPQIVTLVRQAMLDNPSQIKDFEARSTARGIIAIDVAQKILALCIQGGAGD